MSDQFQEAATCERTSPSCDALRAIVRPQEKDLGGFSVRRLMPSAQLRSVGPFIFFDHLGPARFPPGAGIDVRPHPHIGLATVTYLFEGEILHRDSLGNVEAIRPGDINWMTAGSGIAHSERTPPRVRAGEHTLHALQLWIALPGEDEETTPDFHHYDAAELPTLDRNGTAIRVLIGEAFGVRSPVRTFSPTLYLEATLNKGAALLLPDGVEERGVYVLSGALRAGKTPISSQCLAVFEPKTAIELTATNESRIAVIGGRPLGERIVWWNLVASRKERIDRARQAWKEGRFAAVPGETEFIPLPEKEPA